MPSLLWGIYITLASKGSTSRISPSEARGQKLEEARRKIEALLHGGSLVGDTLSWTLYGHYRSENV